ncbi:hypothetical protein CYMTET_4614 [Cymbomonas tetramitiformis]|uniref:EGF-like domain-containing protein n=1 Tax=Cymbomonas tetramitiformis TaxID=36881 RepID=A0AAE0LJP7_9CHLO|nr:hypothetical protein CYMTET_4614 [Cymbomonas tetramitiformis]
MSSCQGETQAETDQLAAAGGSLVLYQSQACNEQACSENYWKHTSWSRCNVTCGGGIQTREVACADSSGNPVDTYYETLCDAEQRPAAQQTCNSNACETYVWTTGAWGQCSAACDSGTQTREVKCATSSGGFAETSLCSSGNEPSTSRVCNTDLCPETAETLSTVTLAPAGEDCTTDGTECCKSGLVAASGECCAEGEKLDRQRACCSSASGMDVCGVCGGDSVIIALDGTCCPGTLDAEFMCCPSGKLDECGVCDGDDSSCKTTGAVQTAVSQEEAVALEDPGSAEYAEYTATFEQDVSTLLNVNADRVQVTSLTPQEKRRALLQSRSLAVGFEVAPPPAEASDGLVVSTGYLLDTFAGSSLGQLSSAGRENVCGNSVCEVGEVCAEGQNPSTCCQLDCPFGSMKTCPSRNTDACSSNGVCQPMIGMCECYVGFTSDACDECAGPEFDSTGYMTKLYFAQNGTCALYVAPPASPPRPQASSEEPPPASTASEEGTSSGSSDDSSGSSSTDMGVVVGGAIGGVAAVGLVGGFLYYRSRKQESTKVVVIGEP